MTETSTTPTPPPPSALLARKRLAIVAEVQRVAKAGYNTNQKYKFATESDIVNMIKDLLVSNSVLIEFRDPKILESVDRPKSTGTWKLLTVEFTVVITDCETGYELKTQWLGQGEDGSDKGLYKAYTGGQKYFLLKNFFIPTGDDPEKDNDQPQGQPQGTGNPPPQHKRYRKGVDDFYGEAGMPPPPAPPTASPQPESPDDLGQSLLDFEGAKAAAAELEKQAPAQAAPPMDIPGNLFDKDQKITQKRVFNFLIAHYRQSDTQAEKLVIPKLQAVLATNYKEDMLSARGVLRILKGISHADVSGGAA